MKLISKSLTALLPLMAVSLLPAQDRQQLRIVGSSTVYPFSSYLAEEFGETTRFKTPVVESTGSGGGHKLFLTGVGASHPDITNSSRRMKVSELEQNHKNGVKQIMEIMIGYDGIALCQNKENAAINLKVTEIVLAVAEEIPVKDASGKVMLVKNPNKYWSDINKDLPKRSILVLGPPSTSGTRDAFHELVMHVGAKALGYPKDKLGKVKYQSIRQDGVWVDSGENDNLIVQKLTRDRTAIGVFGYSFLAENSERIAAATVNGVTPKPDTISSGEYPVSRSLYFYVKGAHIGVIPGLQEFVDLFVSDKMIGPDGALSGLGLIPLPDQMRAQLRKDWASRKNLTAEMLEGVKVVPASAKRN